MQFSIALNFHSVQISPVYWFFLFVLSFSDGRPGKERLPPSSSNAAMYRSWLLCCFNCISSYYACWLHRLPESKRGCSQEILLGFYLQVTSHKLVWIPGLAQSGCPIILGVHAPKVALLRRCGDKNCKGFTKKCVTTNICTFNIELEGTVSRGSAVANFLYNT